MNKLAHHLAAYIWGSHEQTSSIPSPVAETALHLEAAISAGFAAAAYFTGQPLYLLGTSAGIADIAARYHRASKNAKNNKDYGARDPEAAYKSPGIIGQIREHDHDSFPPAFV